MRHRFHSLCPYFAMFPESFAERWIQELTEPGELVFDPFCGRGTTPFQALLNGRRAVGNDLNPVAFCVSHAKTNAPTSRALKQRITWLENRFYEDEWYEAAAALPEFFHCAYAPSTLRQILYLRSSLKWRSSDVDCMLAAISLGALHGESKKSPSYLSNQMPRTISTKPTYSVRYWKEHGYVAPKRNTFFLLRRLVDFRYVSEPPGMSADIYEADFRNLPRLIRTLRNRVSLTVTSPPYLDVTNFEEDQWLRLWFLGGPPHPTLRRVSKDDRYRSGGPYWKFIGDLWRVLGQLMDQGSHVVLRIGGNRLNPDRIVNQLEASASFSQRDITLKTWEMSTIQGRQTRAFRPGTTGCVREIDVCFEVR